MSRASRNAGFTLLEILFVLIIVAGVAGFAVPRLKAGMRRREQQRFLYAVATVSTECWRRAQLDGHTMHLLFDSLNGRVWWEEERVGVAFPASYRASETTRWLFEPDAPPRNEAVLLCGSKDTLMVACCLSEMWNERQQ